MTTIEQIKEEISQLTNPEKAKSSAKFFKTGKGEYGEGDSFLGITVPHSRSIAKKYWKTISVEDSELLLKSKYHEERLLALFILVSKFKKADRPEKEKIFELYLNNTEFVNNWDLVDSSAHYIVGEYLKNEKNRKILYQFTLSDNLWKRRISIISTFCFIRNNDFEDTLRISEILLNAKEDLIHKAVGWMLREIGNRNLETEEEFLIKHYKNMPRTMLRYAVEKFEESKRQLYLKGLI